MSPADPSGGVNPNRDPDAVASEARHLHSFDAVDHRTGKPSLRVHLTQDRGRQVARRGRWAILEMRNTVEQVLQRPTAIFEGIRHEPDDDGRSDGWLCYCGRPAVRHWPNNPDNRPGPPRPNHVFVVFVNRDRVAYLWYWTDCDPAEPRLPKDFQERFVSRVL